MSTCRSGAITPDSLPTVKSSVDALILSDQPLTSGQKSLPGRYDTQKLRRLLISQTVLWNREFVRSGDVSPSLRIFVAVLGLLGVFILAMNTKPASKIPITGH